LKSKLRTRVELPFGWYLDTISFLVESSIELGSEQSQKQEDTVEDE